MNMITQEAKKKQAIVKYTLRKGKSKASKMYGVSLSSVKRWCKQYDGTQQSLLPKSHRPHSHPNRHTKREERQIRNSFKKCYERYGWDGKHFCQWTAIDECTRMRFVYGFEEHTPENSTKFLKMLLKEFPFKIQSVQTDNGREFTYKYQSSEVKSPFEIELNKLGINHKLIPPRTPWHNGKVERSHRNDQRYFYEWETFRNIEELNTKLKGHLEWSNNKTMRTLDYKSPMQLLSEKLELKSIH